MAVVIVVRQASAQLAVQGQQVQHVLQVVAVLDNGLFHGHGVVGLDVRAQPVGLVVGDVVTPVQLERQVDETFEHAVEHGRLRRRACQAGVGVACDKAIELLGVDLVAGEPELHFDLVMTQLPQRHALVAARQRERLAQQASHPLAEGGDPAGPVAAVAALANGALDQLRVTADLAEALAARPFQQAMQEGAGVRPPREAVNVATVGRHLAQYLGIDHFVIQQLLGLRTVGNQRLIADTQGAIRSDPPMLGRCAARLACGQQLTVGMGHAIHLLVCRRQARASDVRTCRRQRLQPLGKLLRACQGKATTQQIAKCRAVQL
ncbi:hypothetical protein D3C80_981440 [compost metagenome]